MSGHARAGLRRPQVVLAAVLAIILGLGAAGPVAAQNPTQSAAALVAEVLFPPQAVTGSDGETHLVYELKLSNTAASGMTLSEVAVFDPDTQRGYAGFTGTSIGERLRIAPNVPPGQTHHTARSVGSLLHPRRRCRHRSRCRAGCQHVVVVGWAARRQPAADHRRPDRRCTTRPGRARDRRCAAAATSPATAAATRRGTCRHCCPSTAGGGTRSVSPSTGSCWTTQNRLWLPQAGRGPVPQDFHIYGKDLLAVADGDRRCRGQGPPRPAAGTFRRTCRWIRRTATT